MIGAVARAGLDAAAFSSLWLAGAAGALVALDSRAMQIALRPEAVGLAVVGTLLVYNVDRLRDLERDRATSPDRSAFVYRHREPLVALAVASGLAATGFAVAAGLRAALVLVPILLLGLFHRRLKRFANAKTAYITAAWLGVVVGLPWTLAPSASHVAWVLVVVGCALTANAIASNVRDDEAAAARIGARRALLVARCIAAAGTALALAAPAPARILAAVPAATLVALLGFRPTERYGLLVVDGALVLGALVGLAVTVGADA